jgi:hypothetical protein
VFGTRSLVRVSALAIRRIAITYRITNGGDVVKYDSFYEVCFTRKTSRNAGVSQTVVVKYDSPLADWYKR